MYGNGAADRLGDNDIDGNDNVGDDRNGSDESNI